MTPAPASRHVGFLPPGLFCLALVAVCLLGSPRSLRAQALPGGAGLAVPGGAGTASAGAGSQVAGLPLGSAAQEGALAGTGYRVGPGDDIAVSIWGENPISEVLRVTPEGKLLIPVVGEVFVDGLELPLLTDRVRASIGRVYKNVEVTVTLVGLRTFQVHVVGEVERPGTYEARAVDRLSSVIARAGGTLKSAGSRRIEIRSADSLRTTADFLRFQRLGDIDSNPLLSDGDLILVPLLRDRVSVFGSVPRPGELELIPGDVLPEIVELAGGLTAGAVVDSVVISGYDRDGVRPRRTTIYSLEPGISDVANLPRVPLEGDDRIFLRRRPRYHEDNLVTLEGEVLFPGVYDIVPRETRLSEVITRAGGFLATAAIEEAQLIRTAEEAEPDRELVRLSKIQPSEMSPEEYDYFRARSRQREGWMAIDFVRLFRQGDTTLDITLEPGDRIVVPKRKNFVKVVGRVTRPGNVTFHPGADAEYYIREAGGFTWDARKGRVRVINGLTGQKLKKNDVKTINPGDTVWVPERPQRDYVGIFRGAISFLTGLATIYLVVDTAANR